MLVLTRKPGEGILIGDEITIKLLEIKGGNIRLGIDAPKNKKIYRQEVYDKIVEENRNAANWDLTDLDSLSINLSHEKKEK